ncbi:MAG TPA: hypothetical protein VM942_08020 [Acidimicrobiales bacterium]|nr:hypothetical protein [Acidimicrobiales bacterium]
MNADGLAPAEVLRIIGRSSEFLPNFAVVAGGPSSAAPMVAIGLGPDQSSWFPRVARSESVEARFVARVTGHIGVDRALEPARGRQHARLVPAFLGWSTVVLTTGRLAGICPRGEAVSGPVDFARGTVVAWSFPLRHAEAAGVVDAGGGPMVAVRSTDRLVGGVMLVGAHRIADGSLVPLAPDDLAVVLNTAIRRRPDPADRPDPSDGRV